MLQRWGLDQSDGIEVCTAPGLTFTTPPPPKEMAHRLTARQLPRTRPRNDHLSRSAGATATDHSARRSLLNSKHRSEASASVRDESVINYHHDDEDDDGDDEED